MHKKIQDRLLYMNFLIVIIKKNYIICLLIYCLGQRFYQKFVVIFHKMKVNSDQQFLLVTKTIRIVYVIKIKAEIKLNKL